VNVRRLGVGDEGVLAALATREPPARAGELLADGRTVFLVAFERDEPIGFVLAYELIRRHGDPSILFLYEVDVAAACRRRGVATALLLELERVARARGIREAFVLTNASNEPAMRLYESLGGVREHDDDVLWTFAYAGD